MIFFDFVFKCWASRKLELHFNNARYYKNWTALKNFRLSFFWSLFLAVCFAEHKKMKKVQSYHDMERCIIEQSLRLWLAYDSSLKILGVGWSVMAKSLDTCPVSRGQALASFSFCISLVWPG